MFSTWQKRFFRVEGDLLCYYHEEPVRILFSAMNFNASQLPPSPPPPPPSLLKKSFIQKVSIYTTVGSLSTRANRKPCVCIDDDRRPHVRAEVSFSPLTCAVARQTTVRRSLSCGLTPRITSRHGCLFWKESPSSST